MDELVHRFHSLAQQWKAERGPHSSAEKLCDHPAYHAIIAMGKVAIPLILEDLRRDPDHWFIALRILTGANPVSEVNRGRMSEMVREWFEWGVKNGHVSF